MSKKDSPVMNTLGNLDSLVMNLWKSHDPPVMNTLEVEMITLEVEMNTLEVEMNTSGS